MSVKDHSELRVGMTIREGKKSIHIATIERHPECICRNSTHVNGEYCYTGKVNVR